MKRMLLTIAAIATVLIFGHCCKVYCPRESMTLAFVGFTRDELDTIIVNKFEAGGFTDLLDSHSNVIGGFSGDTLWLPHFDSEGFDRKKNYEIFVSAASRSFRVTDIKTRRYECTCGQRDGRGVDAYTLDGSPIDSDIVYLTK